jgi:Astacin (Peptidase family M12A)
MREIENQTCVRFVPRTTEADYILIVKEKGCWSSLGRIGGAQKVTLGNGCIYKYIILHELIHALG